MEKHPLTPMTDPDIRRWLRLQTTGEVGLVPLDTVRAGPRRLPPPSRPSDEQGVRLVVTDAVADSDLLALGAALAGHRLVTGGSGIALGLPENFRRAGKLCSGTPNARRRRQGPGRGALRLLLDRLAAAGRGLSELASRPGARSGEADGRRP